MEEMRKNYPSRCIVCGKREVSPEVINQGVAKNYNGKLYKINVTDIPVVRCQCCGEVYYHQDSDRRINEVFHSKLKLAV